MADISVRPDLENEEWGKKEGEEEEQTYDVLEISVF